jgi:threonine dehydratase
MVTLATITLADVQAARSRIRESIRATPAAYSEHLSSESGNTILLKLENLHVTGSYKERGALNGMLCMSDAQRARGVIAASAGNHAQGVAYHAGRLGLRATIVMPLYTPLVKVSATQGWGAEVVLHGENFDEALAEAGRRAEASGATFLHAFNDPAVIAGQGTVGLELLEQIPDLEAVVVPVGGGGLIAGVGCAIKESRPEVRVIGVEPAALPSMSAALAAHRPVEVPPHPTVADGVAVRRVGDLTLAHVEKYVDEMVSVDDEEIAMAILRLLEKQKTLAEGAGAIGVAALLQHRTSLHGKRTAVIISGGNIDVTLLAHIIERGLVKDGRLVRLRIALSDHPGGLQRLTSVIAQERANIVQVIHDRTYFGVHLGEAKIDVTMETRGAAHAEDLMATLQKSGYVFERVM